MLSTVCGSLASVASQSIWTGDSSYSTVQERRPETALHIIDENFGNTPSGTSGSGQQPLTNLNIGRSVMRETIRCLKNVVYFPSVERSQRVKYLLERTTGIGPTEMSVGSLLSFSGSF